VSAVPRFRIERHPGLARLAFAAILEPGAADIAIHCGDAVEADDGHVIAGAWAGAFARRGIAGAATATGTALIADGDGITAVVGAAGAAMLQIVRRPGLVVIANALALALAAADDELVAEYPFYPQDLSTFTVGVERCRKDVPTRRGRLAVHYGSFRIDGDGAITVLPGPRPPRFDSFAAYRRHLVDETRATFDNAGDPARRHPLRPLVALSAGYDSPAAAVIARDAGCREAITFGEPVDRRDHAEDSGAAIAATLGLTVREQPTFAYRDRADLPEIEFIAASFGAGQVYLAGTDLAGRIVASGYGGDRVWGPAYGRSDRPVFPFHIGGYSQNDFFLRQPALDLAIPMIGATDAAGVAAITQGEEMAAFSVGGAYDRPIARRLVEEAGVARGTFAQRKRKVTPDYDNLARRTVDLDDFLSPASRAAFAAWLARERPIRFWRRAMHHLLVASAGRLLWSRSLRRILARVGIGWPPAPMALLHLKVPIRANAFVFIWAVAAQRARYRAALAATAS